MQAVVLAGGRGTRLGPLTHSVPKVLVPVCGRPFLEHLLVRLRSARVTSVLVLAGHLGRQVVDRFGDGSELGLEIAYSIDEPPAGTLGSLRRARELLEPRFLLLNGDTYVSVDYERLAEPLAPSCDGVIVASSAARGVHNLAVDGSGRVIGYRKDGLDGGTHVDAGVAVFRRSVVEAGAAAAEPSSLEHEVYPVLAGRGRLRAHVTELPFYDMGTPAGLEALRRRLC